MSLRILIGLLSFSLLFSNNFFSQSLDYEPIKCEGPIPEIFRTSVAVRFPKTKPISTYNEEMKTKKRIVQEKERNEFLLDFLLKRGKVLFGDSLSDYVNAVADKLMASDPDLRSSLSFYVLRSDEVNAFATSQGLTFVTIGLLSQLENEAQLAFVLAHEIEHHQRDHMNQKIEQRAQTPDYFSRDELEGEDDRLKILSNFSKEMEFQADSLGFFRLKNSGYDVRAALSLLDILQWSFLPIDDIPFNRDFVLFDSLKLPERLLTENPTDIPLFNDEEEVEDGTHPGIARRRTKMSLILSNEKTTGAFYQLDKVRFQRVRYIAQHELIRLQLSEHKFTTALYNSSVLRKNESNNKFIEESIGRALYGAAIRKNYSTWSADNPGKVKVYGHMASCFEFINTMKDEELTFLALRYLYYLEDKYHSADITLFKKDLIADAVKYFGIDNPNYVDRIDLIFLNLKKNAEKQSLPVAEVKSDSSAVDNDGEPMSKYDRLRKDKQEILNAPAQELVNEKMDYEFYFLAYGDSVRMKLRADLTTYFAENPVKSKDDKSTKKTYVRATNSKYPYKVPGSGKVIVVDPYFFLVFKEELSVYDSEKHQSAYASTLDSAFKKLGYGTVNLLSQNYSESDTDLYNKMATLNDWIEEIGGSEDYEKGLLPTNTSQVLALAEASGAQYICTSTSVHTTEDVHIDGMTYLASCVLYPILPFVILRDIIPKKTMYYHYAVYDVNKGKVASEYTGNTKCPANKSAYFGNHVKFLKYWFSKSKEEKK